MQNAFASGLGKVARQAPVPGMNAFANPEPVAGQASPFARGAGQMAETQQPRQPATSGGAVPFTNAFAEALEPPKKPNAIQQGIGAFFQGFAPEGYGQGLQMAQQKREMQKQDVMGQLKAARTFLAQGAQIPEAQRGDWFARNAAAIKAQTGQDPTAMQNDYSDASIMQGLAAIDAQLGQSPAQPEPMSAYEAAQIELKRQGGGDPYTLTPGSKRFGPDGKLIAENPNLTSADGREVHSVGVRADGRQIITYKDGSQEVSPYAVQEMGRTFDIGGVPYEYRPRSGEVGAITTPEMVGQNAGVVAGGTELGKSQAKAITSVPGLIASADKAIASIDELLKAPGFKEAYGISQMFPTIKGTAKANAEAIRDKLDGQFFLAAIADVQSSLAPVSDADARRLTSSMSQLSNPNISDEEARRVAGELKAYFEKAKVKAQQKAQRGPMGAASAVPPAAAAELRADPSPESIREFEEIFGAGSAQAVLNGSR